MTLTNSGNSASMPASANCCGSDQPVPLTPKVFETLLHLVQNHGELLAKDDLMRAVWPDTVVEENNLNQNISSLRRILGQSPGGDRYILTIPGHGYRFVAEVRLKSLVHPSAGAKVIAVLPFRPLVVDDRDEALETRHGRHADRAAEHHP